MPVRLELVSRNSPEMLESFRLERRSFLASMDVIYFTLHERSPLISRTSSSKSSTRKKLLHEDRVMKGSSGARSVQLSGISHWRPFLSRKQALCSAACSLRSRSSNSRPERGWKGWSIRNFCGSARTRDVVRRRFLVFGPFQETHLARQLRFHPVNPAGDIGLVLER